jgi:hypothetical protein
MADMKSEKNFEEEDDLALGQTAKKDEAQTDDATSGKKSDGANESVEEAEAISAINKFTDEIDDNDDLFGKISLKTIISGDFIQSKFFRGQVVWFIVVALLMVAYTANRYQSQQDMITIDSLRIELQNMKCNVLTQSSDLMNLCRQSNVERILKENNDSTLQEPTTPPFLILTESDLVEDDSIKINSFTVNK